MNAIAGALEFDGITDNVIGHAGEYCIQIWDDPSLIKKEWKQLQAEKTAHIYQNYDWVRIASETLERDHQIFIVTGCTTGHNDKQLHFILPFVLESGMFKTLRWIGGSHANINCGVFSEVFLKSDNADTMMAILRLLRKQVGPFVVCRLNNQPHFLKSYPNPLLHLQHQKSVNMMYDMNLTDGMDAILDQGSGKRKRKLWRKQNRVADTMGGSQLVTPTNKDDILAAVDEFTVMKAKRLHDLGIRNVFAGENTLDFLKRMAIEPERDGVHLFRIYQLKIGGKTRAIYAIGIHGDLCQAYVNAVEYDEFADHSPGEMIMYAMVQKLVEDGYRSLDMGVGDERYKRSWCPGQHDLFDNVIPLSVFGAPIAFTQKMKNTIKGYLRNNPAIWNRLKKIRKLRRLIS